VNVTELATPALDATETAFWRSFVRAMLTVPRAMEADLLADQRLTMSEYAVLVHLSESVEHRMRMSDLAAISSLSLSGMTRVVGRLESDGLVDRVKCSVDARGSFACVTSAGLERLERAYPDHAASVRRVVIDNLDGIDIVALTEALNKIASAGGCVAGLMNAKAVPA
jgi:DNA-binding MarR family transcriptional regulator